MPNLTLEDAREQYYEEYKKVLDRRFLIPTDHTIGSRAILIEEALRWLAGKKVQNVGALRVAGGGVSWQEWREDPLRWLLEEVREQLKRENAT